MQEVTQIKCTNNKSIRKGYNKITRNVRTTRNKSLATNDSRQKNVDKAVTTSFPSPHLINLSSGLCDSLQGLCRSCAGVPKPSGVANCQARSDWNSLHFLRACLCSMAQKITNEAVRAECERLVRYRQCHYSHSDITCSYTSLKQYKGPNTEWVKGSL